MAYTLKKKGGGGGGGGTCSHMKADVKICPNDSSKLWWMVELYYAIWQKRLV